MSSSLLDILQSRVSWLRMARQRSKRPLEDDPSPPEPRQDGQQDDRQDNPRAKRAKTTNTTKSRHILHLLRPDLKTTIRSTEPSSAFAPSRRRSIAISPSPLPVSRTRNRRLFRLLRRSLGTATRPTITRLLRLLPQPPTLA
ncbi:hypothetical protein GJ744_001493 [Endocarpon pusillum]|uniref:Uncharacterized protein n=1 Tax=Endocarpon pusillum TaxID=364733 RepID=A0A8H7ACM9_9EURO|nr:hypothetical protein GJ744_001493 [Endocarpon pusillum]